MPTTSRTNSISSMWAKTRWPPQPFVETEGASLSRESGHHRPTDYREAVNRGTINQDPIIIDATTARSVRRQTTRDRVSKIALHIDTQDKFAVDGEKYPTPPPSPPHNTSSRARRPSSSSKHPPLFSPASAPRRSFTAGPTRPIIVEPGTNNSTRPQLRFLSGPSRRHTDPNVNDVQDASQARHSSPLKVPTLLSPSVEGPLLSPSLLSSSIPMHDDRGALPIRAMNSRPSSPAPPLAASPKTDFGFPFGGSSWHHDKSSKSIHRARSPAPLDPIMLSSADSSFQPNHGPRSTRPQTLTPLAGITMPLPRNSTRSTFTPSRHSLLSADINSQSMRAHAKSPVPRSPVMSPRSGDSHHVHPKLDDLEHGPQKSSRHSSRQSSIDETVVRVARAGEDDDKFLASTDRRDSGVLLSSSLRPLPSCRRSEPSTGHHDWLTIRGCSRSAVCPSCYNQAIVGTRFQTFIYPRTPQSQSERIKCNFSDPWLRLAWLLTMERQSSDLGLLASLIKVGHDKQAAKRTDRYTIQDEMGRPVQGFAICQASLDKLHMLLPGFQGRFIAMSSSTLTIEVIEQQCALRSERNNRFTTYMEKLIYLHETARLMGRPPDLKPFVLLVKTKVSIPDCARDDLLSQTRWHYIPALLPAFTICEDCFMDCVLPHLPKTALPGGSSSSGTTGIGSDLAASVTPRATYLPAWAKEAKRGSSCQLYSARMREIWTRAIQGEGIKLLSRKAKQRKEDEDTLQERACAITSRLAELDADEQSGLEAGSGADETNEEMMRLSLQLEDITKEWLELE